MNCVREPAGEVFLTVVSSSERRRCSGQWSWVRTPLGCWSRFCNYPGLGLLIPRLFSQELGSLGWKMDAQWAPLSMGLFSQPVGLGSQHPRQGHSSGSADPPGPPLLGLSCLPGPWCLACWPLPLRKGFGARRHAQVSTCLSVLCQAVEIFIFMLTRKKGIYQSPRCGNHEIGCWDQGIPKIPPHPPSPLPVAFCPGGRQASFLLPTITQAGRGHPSHPLLSPQVWKLLSLQPLSAPLLGWLVFVHRPWALWCGSSSQQSIK